jgi:hypothetical protein
MKLNEVFAKRKTYGYRPRKVRIDALKRALAEYDKLTHFDTDIWNSKLWKEVQEHVKGHIKDYPDDDPMYWTYNATVSFIRDYLEETFEKM